jgi:acyl-CoA synthetase (NDP forming)
MAKSIKDELAPVFYPESIALVGISDTSVNVAYMFLQSLLDSGFPRIYPVNPKGGKLSGLKVYRSIRDIPEEVDLALLTVPREAVPIPGDSPNRDRRAGHLKRK